MGSRVKRKKASQTRPAASRHSRPDNDRLIASVVCILLAGIVWISFGQTLRHEFVNYDDGAYVYANPRIIRGFTPGNVQWAFTHVHAANWHPLTTISHMLDCQLYGLQPWGHHLTNILLHSAAAILLFFAVRELTGGGHAVAGTGSSAVDAAKAGDGGRDQRSRLQHGGSLWASAFVAALFATHPVRVESVAWVAERKDVLSGVFFMLTLWAYARYARSDRFSLSRYTTVLIVFALGLMCKPTLVTLPFVLLLLDYWPLRRTQNSDVGGHKSAVAAPLRGALPRRTRLRVASAWQAAAWLHLIVEKIPFFVLSAAACVATILAQREAFAPLRAVPLQERLANAVVAYVAYMGQAIYPAHLAVLYPYPEGGLNVAEVIVALLFLLIVSVIFFLWRKTYPFALTGWFWFLGMLVPMIGIVQVGSQPMADRYTYLSEIGLYILATWGAMRLFDKWRHNREVLAVAALLTIGALITRSYFQTSYWLNSETLWRHTIDVTSRNYISQNNLAGTLLDSGQLKEAIAHYREALEIKPNVAQVQSNLGNALLREGEVEEAIVHLQRALQIDPAYAEAYNHMGSALMKKGQAGEAIGYYQKAVQLNTSYADAYNNLGVAFLRNGQVDEAIAYYKKAVAINPESAEMQYNLGNTLARKGNWAEAIICYQAALSTERDSVKAAKVRNNLGAALEKLGKSDEALEQFSEALQINGNYPEAHCNLGRMLAQRGRRDEAVAHLREAVRLKPGYEEARKQLRELGVTGQ
jgi:tetratricopeptide (TPR) repeat protein